MIIVILLAALLHTVYGTIDGMLRPAVSNVTIAAVPVPDRPDWSLITGKFFKLRPACRFDGIKASYHEIPVILELIEGTKDRGGGWHDYGPWRVQIAPDQLPDLRIQVFHVCAGGVDLPDLLHDWWPRTVTTFHPTFHSEDAK